jgi:integrase
MPMPNAARRKWTAHDLRRTGSTIMQSLGVPEHVRERCLNHVVGGKLGRVYGRYEFANEKREAWKRLGEFLDATLTQRSAGE